MTIWYEAKQAKIIEAALNERQPGLDWRTWFVSGDDAVLWNRLEAQLQVAARREWGQNRQFCFFPWTRLHTLSVEEAAEHILREMGYCQGIGRALSDTGSGDGDTFFSQRRVTSAQRSRNPRRGGTP